MDKKRNLFSKSTLFRMRKPKHQTVWLDLAAKEQVAMEIEDPEILKQLEMIGLSTNDIAIAKAIQPLIMEHIDEIVSEFYETITNVEHLKSIIVDHSTLDRLRKTLETHLIEMFSGQFNQDFLEKRIRIAKIHYRIGLEPKWYMGAFQNLQNSLLQLVNRHVVEQHESMKLTQVVTKILNFEQQLVLEAYEKENLLQRQLQYDEIKSELKAKIINVCADMTHIAERTHATVQELVASSEIVNGSVLRGADTSRDTQNLAHEGQDKLLELKQRIDSIFNRANTVKDFIEELDHSVQGIGRVVSLVQSIADQTNLLSINSTIEAAHAGEHGRGFSVVAEEIRKLASETKSSIGEIQSYIDETQDFTTKVVSVIAEVHHFVQEGKNESDAADSTFHRILDSMSTFSDDVDNVVHGMSSLTDHIKEISESIREVSVSADTLYAAVENL